MQPEQSRYSVHETSVAEATHFGIILFGVYASVPMRRPSQIAAPGAFRIETAVMRITVS